VANCTPRALLFHHYLGGRSLGLPCLFQETRLVHPDLCHRSWCSSMGPDPVGNLQHSRIHPLGWWSRSRSYPWQGTMALARGFGFPSGRR
jgi:hypothetical protein